MKNLKDVLLALTFLMALFAIGLNLISLPETSTSVYVRSHDLIYNYEGMRDAQMVLENKRKVYDLQLDSIQNEFQLALNKYTANAPQMDLESRQALEKQLKAQQEGLMQYAQSIDVQLEEEEKRLLEGVLNQVNSFARNYGKEHNLDYVFGTTVDGNLLFGREDNDVTEELLAALNQSYHGE